MTDTWSDRCDFCAEDKPIKVHLICRVCGDVKAELCNKCSAKRLVNDEHAWACSNEDCPKFRRARW